MMNMQARIHTDSGTLSTSTLRGTEMHTLHGDTQFLSETGALVSESYFQIALAGEANLIRVKS